MSISFCEKLHICQRKYDICICLSQILLSWLPVKTLKSNSHRKIFLRNTSSPVQKKVVYSKILPLLYCLSQLLFNLIRCVRKTYWCWWSKTERLRIMMTKLHSETLKLEIANLCFQLLSATLWKAKAWWEWRDEWRTE